MSPRNGWLATALACAAMLAFALYSQYALELYPCPLCIFQRVAVMALLVVALLAALHNPGRRGQTAYGVAGILAAGVGAAIAGRHVWIQHLPADQVPACGAGLEFMLETLPLMQVIRDVLTASGECASIDWQFLGLSMPAWVAICMLLLMDWVIWIAFIRPRRVKT